MKKITRRKFIGGAAAVGAGMAFLPGTISLAEGTAETDALKALVPTLKTRTAGRFSILAVTDLHFYIGQLSPDEGTVADIRKMLEQFDVDLLVITGDMWHNNPGGRGYSFCKWVCKQLSELPVPWAFAWGNHDQMDDYDKGHKLLSRAENSMYAGGASDGNYRIAVRDDENGPAIWNLIFLNDSQGGMKQPQVDWFNGEAARIKSEAPAPAPAFLFFHIPIPQYFDIARPGAAKGVMKEGVAFEQGEKTAFSAFKDSGFVRGMFCGHDHVNDFQGKFKGVHIEYLRATGREGYGGDRVPKGGTLITVDAAGDRFKTETVFPDGTKWIPEGFNLNEG